MAEMWELLAASLISRASRNMILHQKILPAEMEQAHIFVRDCLDERKSRPAMNVFAAASDVAHAFGLNVLKNEVTAYKKRCVIDRHLTKNHWQMALQIASTKGALTYLYNCLRKVSYSGKQSAPSCNVSTIPPHRSKGDPEAAPQFLHPFYL
jgi:hypothetical protein